MRTIILRRASFDDIMWVGAHLRPDDAREVVAVSGLEPEQRMAILAEQHRDTYSLRLDAGEKPVAIYGVAEIPGSPDIGSAWFLATRRIREAAKIILKHIPVVLEDFAKQYPKGLIATVLAKNDLHARWCEVAGFRPIGVTTFRNELFHILHRPA